MKTHIKFRTVQASYHKSNSSFNQPLIGELLHDEDIRNTCKSKLAFSINKLQINLSQVAHTGQMNTIETHWPSWTWHELPPGSLSNNRTGLRRTRPGATMHEGRPTLGPESVPESLTANKTESPWHCKYYFNMLIRTVKLQLVKSGMTCKYVLQMNADDVALTILHDTFPVFSLHSEYLILFLKPKWI